jgi:hypothetical protein
MGENLNKDERKLNNIGSFVRAGKAVFTVVNEETGNRFTFRVKKHDTKNFYFVSVLTGSDNTSDYTYIGCIFGDDFRRTKGSRVTEEAQSFKVFSWFMSNLEDLPSQVKVYHENRCGRCGRALTVPESVVNGFGPECIKKIGR